MIAMLLGTTSLAVAPTHALAADTMMFDISSKPLEEALRRYAGAAGQQVAYQAGDIEGKVSKPLHGRYSARAGLDALLVGTGLKAERLRSGVYRIYAPEVPKTRQPVTALPGKAEAVEVPSPVVVIRGDLSDSELSLRRRDALGREARTETTFRKLPETSVPDVLQHMGGVQVAGDRGEINRIGIRGLSEVNTLINGREIYSDAGRTLSLEYVPTNIFAGVDIYRTSGARMIEGGVGGAIDLRTRRPLDLRDGETNLMLRLGGRDHSPAAVQFTGLFNRRFQTSRGEVGLLISVADLPTHAYQDSIGIEPFGERNDLVDRNRDGLPNDLVLAPRGGGGGSEAIDRRRTALQITGQWRPSETLTMALELTGLGYSFSRDSYVIYANRGALAPLPGANFVFSDYPGEETVVLAGAYTDVVFTSNTNYYDLAAHTGQIAYTADWRPDARTRIEVDLSHTRSRRTADWGGLRIGNSGHASGSRLTFDVRGRVPHLALSGVDATNPALYNLIDSSHSLSAAEGAGTALQININRKLAGPRLRSVDFGVRFGARDIESQAGSRQHLTGDLGIATLPEAASLVPVTNFFRNRAGASVFGAGILGAAPELVRDIGRVCASVGDAVCYPAYIPAQGYAIRETTRAGYGQVNYELPLLGAVVTGNAGVRVIEMDRAIDGILTSNLGQLSPVHLKSKTFDMLPSVNARIAVTPSLHVRFSAGRQLTRPNFAQLSPVLTVGYANANQTLTASVGNPELKALRSTSIDVSVERYFPQGSYAYGILFRKEVDGFVQAVLRTEPVAFPDYPGFNVAEMTRLQNGSGGVIQGYQLGFVAALKSHPEPWKGLSAQANFTHVDSTAPSPLAGSAVPLVGLSRNNYNLVLSYERGGFHTAAAYTYRDDFVDTITGPGSGSLPVFSRPYGTLDASIGYRFNPSVELDLELSNIGRADQGSYFGVPDRPRFVVEGLLQAAIVLRISR